jgi:DNA-binding YbaB/EbfC family protein
MKNIGQFLKQAQQMQAKMAEMQEKLAHLTVEGTSGGGMVVAVATGKGDIKSIKIKPELVDPKEVEILEDLIVAAINDAKAKAEAAAAEEMSKITGGMNLPGGMKLPF